MEGLTGEVGTIDIPGEQTSFVNIRPGEISSNAYDGNRDGDMKPFIALGAWSSFLVQCMLPGWQKWKPLHRYAWIIDDTIDYFANTCAVAIQDAFSSQQSLSVNDGDKLGIAVAPSGEYAHEFFTQNVGSAHPGFVDFVARNPSHPISQVTELNSPITLSDEQYIQLARICRHVDYSFRYESDRSGYRRHHRPRFCGHARGQF